MPALSNYPVRSRQYVRRYRDAYLLSGFQVNDQFKLSRLLHRQIGRFRAFEDLVNVCGGAPVQVQVIHAVGQETSGFHLLCILIDCRKPALYRKLCNRFSVRAEDRARYADEDSVGTLLCCGLECGLKILKASDIETLKLDSEGVCGDLDFVQYLCSVSAGWTEKNGQTRELGNNFLHNLKSFSH